MRLLNTVGATLKPKVFCVGELAEQGAGHPDFKFTNVQGEVGVNKRGYCDGCNLGLYDWGYSSGSRGDKLIADSGDELEGATLAELEMNKAVLLLPTYPRYDLLLALDPTLVE